MRAELPTGTVTFLFTDVEGSTRLLHELGPARYAEAESLPRWAGERAQRGGALVEEDREPFASAAEGGRALDLWDAAAIALGE